LRHTARSPGQGFGGGGGGPSSDHAVRPIEQQEPSTLSGAVIKSQRQPFGNGVSGAEKSGPVVWMSLKPTRPHSDGGVSTGAEGQQQRQSLAGRRLATAVGARLTDRALCHRHRIMSVELPVAVT
jgi:hypothetical protein